MPSRNWDGQLAPFIVLIGGLAAIALVAFTLIYSKGYQAADQRNEAENAARNTAQQHYQECVAKLTAQEALECYQRAEKAARDDQRADQDLNAQREMADWAEGMLWASVTLGVTTIIITGLGVYYVRRTLAESVRATNAAVEAAKAGQKANEIAEDAAVLARRLGQAQVRSYLSCIGGKFSAYRGFLMLTFSVRNTGQTPAMQCFINYRVRWFSSETGEIWLPEKQVEAFFIGAGLQETTGGYLSVKDGLTAEMGESFRTEDMIVSGECVMKWTDIFGTDFTQHFFFHEIGESQTDKDRRSGELKATNVRPRRLAGEQQQG